MRQEVTRGFLTVQVFDEDLLFDITIVLKGSNSLPDISGKGAH